MRYVQIIIEGDYWDYLLKDNLMYLWHFNGVVSVYNWDYLVLDFTIKNNNPSIYQLLQNKANRSLSKPLTDNFTIELTSNDIEPYLLKKIDSPFNDLPILLETYRGDFYAILDKGLFKVNNLESRLGNTERLWDSKLFDFTIKKNGRISMSGGNEGLFEHYISTKETKKLSDRHSTESFWNNTGIYSASLKDESYLILNNDMNKYFNEDDQNIVIFEDEIFSNKVRNGGISWSSNNRFYRVFDNNKLEVVNFNVVNKELIKKSKVIEFNSWKGRILSGGSAIFGNIIECENALVIIHKNSFENIPEEVVTWKVNNNNPHYLNHLGIVFENKICIRGYQL